MVLITNQIEREGEKKEDGKAPKDGDGQFQHSDEGEMLILLMADSALPKSLPWISPASVFCSDRRDTNRLITLP